MFYRYEYVCVFFFIITSFSFVFVLFLISYLVSPKKINSEKVSPYECGFNPFEDSRTQFDIKFYLISILFIIFDLEVIFLFPWSITLSYTRYFGFFSMFLFLIILTIGFIYEWKKGALDLG